MKWKLCLYEAKSWFNKKFEPKVIKELDFEPEIGMNVEVNGKVYYICSLSPGKNIASAKVIEFNNDPAEEYNEDFTCPFCGYVDHDAFELEAEGVINCGGCGSKLEYSREITISYSVIPIKKNEPIKVS